MRITPREKKLKLKQKTQKCTCNTLRKVAEGGCEELRIKFEKKKTYVKLSLKTCKTFMWLTF